MRFSFFIESIFSFSWNIHAHLLELFQVLSVSLFLSWVSSSPFIVPGSQKSIRCALWPTGDTNGPLGVNYTLHSKLPHTCSEKRSIYSPITNIKTTERACICTNGKHANPIQEFVNGVSLRSDNLKLS